MVGCSGTNVVGSLTGIVLYVAGTAVSVCAQVLARLAPQRPFLQGALRRLAGHRRVRVRRGQRGFRNAFSYRV